MSGDPCSISTSKPRREIVRVLLNEFFKADEPGVEPFKIPVIQNPGFCVLGETIRWSSYIPRTRKVRPRIGRGV